MQRLEILKTVDAVIDIAQKICSIIGKPFMDAYNEPTQEEQKLVDAHWQEISRIVSENSAKPEIQGYSEHE